MDFGNFYIKKKLTMVTTWVVWFTQDVEPVITTQWNDNLSYQTHHIPTWNE